MVETDNGNLTLYSAEAIIVPHRMCRWYIVRWRVGCYFGTARRGLGGAAARPGPSSLYQMWQHTVTGQCTGTVYQLLYDGPLLCGLFCP